MKKALFLILLLSASVFSGCGGTIGNDEGTGTVQASADPASPENEGKVVYLNTEDFRKLVWDYKQTPDTFVFKGDRPVIIDFYADWCRPCKLVAPIMEELAQEYKGKITIYKVNTDMERELSSTFQIRSIPAILYVPKEGKPQMSVGLQAKSAYVQSINDILKVK
jgi:thioredoxin 1